MLHIACRADIPPDAEWAKARRRPTLQDYVRTHARGSVSSDYGSLICREPDVLIQGVSGAWHPLMPEDLNAAYIEEPADGRTDDVLVFDAGGARLIQRLSRDQWNRLVQRDGG